MERKDTKKDLKGEHGRTWETRGQRVKMHEEDVLIDWSAALYADF